MSRMQKQMCLAVIVAMIYQIWSVRNGVMWLQEVPSVDNQ